MVAQHSKKNLDIQWEVLKKKLTNNYGSIKNLWEAYFKLQHMQIKPNETVGEYIESTSIG